VQTTTYPGEMKAAALSEFLGKYASKKKARK
jgi:hypothetical protein